MANSYRLRTKVGVDSYLSVQLDQDFEYLEILSLKILPEQIYTHSVDLLVQVQACSFQNLTDY